MKMRTLNGTYAALPLLSEGVLELVLGDHDVRADGHRWELNVPDREVGRFHARVCWVVSVRQVDGHD